MESIFAFGFSNVPICLLALSLFAAGFTWTGESLCRWMLLLPIGLRGLWGFAFHAFASQEAAAFVGWQQSPFQYEVAAASLGLGIAGIVGFWRSWEFALAATLMAFFYQEGAAVIHIIEVLFEADYHLGNAGTVLFTDLTAPFLLVLGLCLWKQEIRQKERLTDQA